MITLDFEAGLQGIVVRVPLENQPVLLSHIRVHHGTACNRAGPDIPSRSRSRDYDVGIVLAEGEMYAARTTVGHRPNHAAEFVLQIEIPLHHITARGIRLDVTRALTCQPPWYVTLQHRGRGSRHRSGIALRD